MRLRTRSTPRRRGLLILSLFAALAVALTVPATAGAVSGAAFTTDNPNAGDVCLHGPSGSDLAVNCNLYASKEHVWINGGPSQGQNSLSDGTYFFAVLVPGGQPDPNDDGAKNLSDANALGGTDDECGSAYTDRTFTVDDGKIASFTGAGDSCSYATDSHYDPPMGLLVNLFPYDTTSNPGGVYILAICSLADGYPVSPRDCKYDAFKVRRSDGEEPPAADLTVIKNVQESFDRTYAWTIDKAVDKTLVQTTANTATFNYTVTVSHDSGTDSGWKANGTITVFNPNTFAVTVDVTDSINDPNASCVVTDGTDVSIPAESSEEFDYSCTYSDEPASGTENTAVAAWDTTGDLAAGTADFSVGVDFSGATPDLIDDCIDVTDDFDGAGPVALGTVCVGDPGHVVGDATKWEFKYNRVIDVPRNTCASHNNTAAFETDDTQATGSSSETVTVCGPITGGFTLGYWSNKNGQGVLCDHDPAWRNLINALNLVGANGAAFNVQLTGACNNNGAYGSFRAWLLAGIATNMSYMLSVQMATTALDVAYKGMLGTACVAHPVTGVPITINALIAEANTFLLTNTNTTASGPARTLAEKYKNAFDALNNNLAFAVLCP